MYKVAVIGAAGFAGIETVRLLMAHPAFELVAASSNSDAGKALSAIYPFFAGRTNMCFVRHETVLHFDRTTLDLVFLAVPHSTSMSMVPTLLKRGIPSIDLSADFRLHCASVYEKWYGVKHTAPELIDTAVYGLPEVYRSALKEKKLQSAKEGKPFLIANPGCYPTASVLAALPVVKAQLDDPESIVVINAISGVSGAGKKPSEATHFCLAHESLAAYAVTRHRHTPEIAQTLSQVAGRKIAIQFTPHLAPLGRGMVATANVRLSKEGAKAASAEAIQALYESYYEAEPFVQVLPQGTMPKSGSVKYSNCAQLGVAYDAYTRMVVASCAIDNLGKGAASQAVQCANIMFSLEETTGLSDQGGLL